MSLPERKWLKEFLAEVSENGKMDKTYQTAKKEATGELAQKDQKTKEKDRLLYWENLLWVPEGSVQRIMESEHNTKVAGHMGQDKTIELIRQNFWWPKMNERIIEFVRSCL